MDDETPQCTATSSRSGKRCRRQPIKGGTVCATHGGRAPQVVAAAQRRLVAMEAAGVVIVCATGRPLARYCHPHSAPKHPGGTR